MSIATRGDFTHYRWGAMLAWVTPGVPPGTNGDDWLPDQRPEPDEDLSHR